MTMHFRDQLHIYDGYLTVENMPEAKLLLWFYDTSLQ